MRAKKYVPEIYLRHMALYERVIDHMADRLIDW